MINIAVIIYQDKAYLPTDEYYDRMYIANDPVYVSELNVEDLAEKISIRYEVGNPIVESLSIEDRKSRSSVVLRATGAKSWKAMARSGASYVLYWKEGTVRYTASMLDPKGRWTTDRDKTVMMPADTPIAELAQMILDDWNSRSESQ